MRVRERRGERAIHFRVKAYGDFSLATEPEMTLQISVGSNAGGVTKAWKKTNRGWILHQRDFND
jgi:hypothetical protein